MEGNVEERKIATVRSKRINANILACSRELEKAWDLTIRQIADLRPGQPQFIVSFRGLNAMQGTPYEDATIRVRVMYLPDYPFKPPVFTMETEMFHPNVGGTGVLCDGKIHSQCPAEMLHHSILNIISLLIDPSLDDIMNIEAASLFLTDREMYDSIAKSILKG